VGVGLAPTLPAADGYVDHTALRPDSTLFRHFIEET
jgi:hypothetical protein